MDSLHSIMDKRKKGTHLSLEERVIIQTRLKDQCSLRSIAREIGCSPSTIHYEIKRGAVKLYHGKVKRYKASWCRQYRCWEIPLQQCSDYCRRRATSHLQKSAVGRNQ